MKYYLSGMGKRKIFQGKDSRRVNIVMQKEMHKRLRIETGPDSLIPTMSELIHAALVEYFEKRDGK